MANNPFLSRDGTSQAMRSQAALSPEYVAIDEHDLRDLLTFARAYAKELRYWDVENGAIADLGDWSGFLSDDLDLDEVVAYIREPARFANNSAYRRPHFALFLAFLQLLGMAQEQMNQMTRRHLDFYYQQILHMTKKAGVPDHVNVLVALADDTEQFVLPAGTLLNAGTDSIGQDVFYSTSDDLLVNHAQIARLSSMFVEKSVMGIRATRETYEGPKDEAFMRMLELALGQPTPGDPLPPYASGAPVTYDFVLGLQNLTDFVRTGLHLRFSDFEALMLLKIQRDYADHEWAEINSLLESAGITRTKNPNYRLNPTNPRDFDANLEKALGGKPNFDGLTEVEDIYDVYEQRIRQVVQEFIQEDLYFPDLTDFYRMMQIKIRIDNQWAEIRRILEEAGQKKRNQPDFKLPLDSGPPDFNALLNAAVGPLTYPSVPGGGSISTVDAFYNALRGIESYFFMLPEAFDTIVSITQKPEANPQEWARVYQILEGAHQQMVYTERRLELQSIREMYGFDPMIEFANGDDAPTALSALDRLAENISSPEDRAFLYEISLLSQQGSEIGPLEWQQTYEIVERAQRVRLGTPVAQVVQWINLHPVADATSLIASTALDGEDEHTHWKTFGMGQVASSDDEPPPPNFGWAIRSPMLALSEGNRSITVTLGFNPAEFDGVAIADLLSPQPHDPHYHDRIFEAQLSTEKGWMTLDSMVVQQITYNSLTNIASLGSTTLPALQFKIILAKSFDPVVPLPDSTDDWPMLRIMLAQNWRALNLQGTIGRYITHYQLLSPLMLQRAHVAVSVDGLTPSRMQNDESVLEPGKPFEPFGTNAVAGTRFYLSHPELVYKRLNSLAFNIEWLGVPNDDLTAHYKNYTGITTASFTTQISLIDERLEVPFNSMKTGLLFEDKKAKSPRKIAIANVRSDLAAGRPGYQYQRVNHVDADDDLLHWNRYIQWEMNAPGFQQDTYPTLAVDYADRLTSAIAADQKPAAGTYRINPPYTPKVKRLLLDYTASEEIILAAYTPGSEIDSIFHIQPFGYNEIIPDPGSHLSPFLAAYHDEGTLYIGITGIAAPNQQVSLLFQLADGTADPDLEIAPVHWDYLSDDRWHSLDNGHVLRDTTRNLINSGIIVFELPTARPGTLLPSDLYWIRATIPYNSQSICDMVTIRAQAVTATFVDHDNAPDHLSRPLPAGSITELADPLPAITSIEQPFTSVGGMMPEQDAQFYTRISERLRHKDRALTLWDYERLVLEQFPEIYKVKCLPPTPDSPGEITVIVIPNIRDKLPFNPFEPKAPANLIASIEDYLQGCIPAVASVKVKNAHYVAVKVRFAVRLRPGYNEGFYRQLLNEELNHFLAPWAYDDGADIVIGSRIYANTIINFIEERPYVDYVAEIKLFTSEDGHTFRLTLPQGAEGYWVEAARPDSVLVAARQHEIDMIVEDRFVETSFRGINYMKIELDFIVG